MKNFTNNFKQFTSRLSARWLIMALMMLVGTSSAWGWNQSNVELFFDNSTSKWTNCYVYIGKDDYTSCYALTRVSGTQYLWKLDKGFNSGKSWDGATGWVVSKEKWWDGQGENVYKFVYHGNNNVTNIRTTAWDNTTIYKADGTTNVNHYSTNCTVYNFSTSTKSDYTVTINSPTGGTLTVKDYDNNTVSNGTSKIGLTVLKFSASASTGYTFKEVQIYNGSSTTKISAANLASQTYTITSNVTITPVWTAKTYDITYKDQGGANFSGTHASGYPTKHTYGTATTLKTASKTGYTFGGWFTNSACTGTKVTSLGATAYTANITLYAKWELACVTPDAPFEGIEQLETICKGSPYEFDSNYKWYTGSTGETTVSGSKEINSNTDYYIVNVAPEGCESARTKYTINVDEPLVAPTLIPTNPTTCNGNPTAGSIVIENYAGYPNDISFVLYKGENPTEITYNNGYAISEEGSYKVVMTTSASNVCGQSVETEPIKVTVQDNTPDATVSITGDASFCEGGNTVLTCNVTDKKGNVTDYQWYNGEEPIQGATASTYTANAAGSYKVVVTVLNSTCQDEFWSDEKVVTINPKPSEPVLSIPSPICAGSNFTLPEEDNNQRTITWDVNNRELTNLTAGTHNYTAKIIDVKGCESNEVTYTITVTALPEITSISQDVQEPVFYEDVTLTATATAGATVKWYDGGIEEGTGNTYVVTSARDASKTVTAKAFLNGCESAVASHTVNFSAEKCSTGKTKIRFRKTYNNNEYYGFNTGSVYLYSWDSKTSATYTGSYPGTLLSKTETINGITYYVHEFTNAQSTENLAILFRAQYDYGGTLGKTYDIPLSTPGATYQIELKNGDKKKETDDKDSDNSNSIDYFEVNSTPSGGGITITLPAAKTTLLETTEGEGNIDFNGQVVKTGCAETLTYGFAYSTDANADKNSWTKVESTNNGNTVGSTFSGSVNELQDGTYYVCAYITNSAGTAFGAVNEITVSNIKYPIKNISLDYCNRGGVIIPDPNPMCKGTTAYIKLDYEGSRYSEYKWLINGVATDRIQNFNNNVWVFNIQGDETVTVELRNDSNKDGETPTWATSNKLTFTMVAEPTTPTVSLSPNVICSNNDGATLSIASVAVGQTYVLYKYADENDNEGAEVDGYDALTCIDAKDELSFTNLTQAGRYFVKTYNTDNCRTIMSASSFATLEVVDASDVFIGFEPTTATTTPWMPAKFTVNASDKYTLTVPEGVVYNIDGNKVSVKIPLPEGTQHVTGQYQNVTFPQGAKTSYTITANLATSGGVDNPCAAPAEATITLTPYVEPCTEGH